MNVQIIEKDGQPEWAVLPYEEYKKLLEQAEMQADIAAFDKAMHQLDSGEDEIVPEPIANRLLAGENPIRVWREYRQLTQTQLANQLNVSTGYLSQLETGKRNGTADLLSRIAQALHIDLEDLLS